jgi:hypothetical protein
LFAGVVLGLVGCSGESSNVDELRSVPRYFIDAFDNCRDEAQSFRNNPTSFFENYGGGRVCGSTEDHLVIKASELSDFDPYRNEFDGLVRLVTRASKGFSENTALLAEQWKDCYSEVGQRLLCLDLVISDSDSNSRAYDSLLEDVETLEEFIPKFEKWLRD